MWESKSTTVYIVDNERTFQQCGSFMHVYCLLDKRMQDFDCNLKTLVTERHSATATRIVSE